MDSYEYLMMYKMYSLDKLLYFNIEKFKRTKKIPSDFRDFSEAVGSVICLYSKRIFIHIHI
jgi:hypothetical protein